MGCYPTLDRAFKEIGVSWESADLLDRLCALRPGAVYTQAFIIRLQAAGWSSEEIQQALEEARVAAEELRARGEKTREEREQEMLREAYAKPARTQLPQHSAPAPSPHTPAPRSSSKDPQTQTLEFLASCYLLRYKRRAREILQRATREFWNRSFTLQDFIRLADCSRSYALRLIGYALRLRVLEIAHQGTRGRGHATLYRFRLAPKSKNDSSCTITQSKEYIACARRKAIRTTEETGDGAQVAAPQQLPPRRCKRVKYYVETFAPIVYRENVKYRYPFWRDFVYGTRLRLQQRGFSPEQTHLVTAIAARWIIGRPIIRAYEFLTTTIDALTLLPPHKRTTRRILWTLRFYLNYCFLRIRLQSKWYIDITPERRRKLNNSTSAQSNAPQNPTNEHPTPNTPPEIPHQCQLTPQDTVTVWLYTPEQGWTPLGTAPANPNTIETLLPPHLNNPQALQRALQNPNQPVLLNWHTTTAGQAVTPYYLRLEPQKAKSGA